MSELAEYIKLFIMNTFDENSNNLGDLTINDLLRGFMKETGLPRNKKLRKTFKRATLNFLREIYHSEFEEVFIDSPNGSPKEVDETNNAFSKQELEDIIVKSGVKYTRLNQEFPSRRRTVMLSEEEATELSHKTFPAESGQPEKEKTKPLPSTSSAVEEEENGQPQSQSQQRNNGPPRVTPSNGVPDRIRQLPKIKKKINTDSYVKPILKEEVQNYNSVFEIFKLTTLPIPRKALREAGTIETKVEVLKRKMTEAGIEGEPTKKKALQLATKLEVADLKKSASDFLSSSLPL